MNLAGKYLNFGVDASIPNLGSFVPSGTEKTFYGNPSFTQDGFTKGLTTSKDVPLDRYGRPSFIQDGGSTNSLTAQLPPKQNPFELKKEGTFEDTLKQLLLIRFDPAYQQRELENASVFQERQMRKALPYNMLYKGLDTLSKLPEQISGRAADRAMNIVLGARNATEAYNLAAASYPRTNFQSTASPTQRNYFA